MADGTAMPAWVVTGPRPVEEDPLHLVEKPPPVPAGDELLVRGRPCEVCRTDLHVAEGDFGSCARRAEAALRHTPFSSRPAHDGHAPGHSGYPHGMNPHETATRGD